MLGKRKRRRQKRRWRDEITDFIDTTWTREAEDRCAWREHEESLGLHVHSTLEGHSLDR